jgi:hypothetical protein
LRPQGFLDGLNADLADLRAGHGSIVGAPFQADFGGCFILAP